MQHKDCHLSFNKIYILESLKSDERHTGRALFKDSTVWKDAYLPQLTITYLTFNDRSELDSILSAIEDATKTKNELPFIHIEAHANEDALGTAGGEAIPWQDLFKSLQRININTRNNLLVVVAACFGFHLFKITDVLERAPFYAVLGPRQAVSFNEVEAGYQVFYQELFKTKEVNGAIAKMNETLKSTGKRYGLVTCEDLFTMASKSYLKEHCSAKAILQRVEGIVSQYQELETKTLTIQEVRRKAKESLKNGNLEFVKEYYRTFVMVDLYPENTERFEFDFSTLVHKV
ncbi:MAG: hypothetical protein GJT30_17505 [Geobacter sp.]|nr:hypothetical protein [Geobacter sp.]